MLLSPANHKPGYNLIAAALIYAGFDKAQIRHEAQIVFVLNGNGCQDSTAECPSGIVAAERDSGSSRHKKIHLADCENTLGNSGRDVAGNGERLSAGWQEIGNAECIRGIGQLVSEQASPGNGRRSAIVKGDSSSIDVFGLHRLRN